MKRLVIFFSVLVMASLAVAEEKAKAEVKPLKVGEKAPDFNVQSLDGKKSKLSQRFGKKGHPVVLLFSRAHW